MGELLQTRDSEGIVTLTLSRPERLNALTKPLWVELGRAFRDLDQDDRVRCIVLRGAGDRSFSPGNDIAEFETQRATVAQARDYGAIMHETLAAIRDCRHPVVALIQGICVGGGLELASLCDLRICNESARFGVPVNRLGLVMAHAEMAGLLDLAGPAVTLEILLEGRVFGANEAREKGLVTRVVADDRVVEEAYAAARRIAEAAPLANRWHKRFLRRLRQAAPLTEQEREEGFACFGTEDFQIGYKAFLAKTKPKFGGR